MNSTSPLRGRSLLLAAAMLTVLVAGAPVAVASTTSTTLSVVPTKGVSRTDCSIAASDQVRVISRDGGCTVATHVGASFEIVLGQTLKWSAPQSSSKSVIVTNMTKTSLGVVSFVLTATSQGVTNISVTGAPHCKKGEACPDFIELRQWKVIVTKSASSALTLRLTSSNAGDYYNVRPGDRFIVSLNAAPQYKWNEPSVTTANVVRRIAGRAGASAAGLFVAHSSGRTKLVATQTPNCGARCSAKKHRFSVNVVVTSKS